MRLTKYGGILTEVIMNILAVSSHPDDLEYGCGGTLLKYSRDKKAKIYLLVLTKGDVGGDPKVRTKEQGLAARILGAKKIFWGGYKDTQVPNNKGLISKIEVVIKEVNPDLIFVSYRTDTHQDHRHAAASAISATRHMRNVLFYEVPTTTDFSPTVFVDIGDVLEDKIKLLEAHKSQIHATRITDLNILESAKSCANFRGFQGRVRYAEGFVPMRLALEV